MALSPLSKDAKTGSALYGQNRFSDLFRSRGW